MTLMTTSLISSAVISPSPSLSSSFSLSPSAFSVVSMRIFSVLTMDPMADFMRVTLRSSFSAARGLASCSASTTSGAEPCTAALVLSSTLAGASALSAAASAWKTAWLWGSDSRYASSTASSDISRFSELPRARSLSASSSSTVISCLPSCFAGAGAAAAAAGTGAGAGEGSAVPGAGPAAAAVTAGAAGVGVTTVPSLAAASCTRSPTTSSAGTAPAPLPAGAVMAGCAPSASSLSACFFPPSASSVAGVGSSAAFLAMASFCSSRSSSIISFWNSMDSSLRLRMSVVSASPLEAALSTTSLMMSLSMKLMELFSTCSGSFVAAVPELSMKPRDMMSSEMGMCFCVLSSSHSLSCFFNLKCVTPRLRMPRSRHASLSSTVLRLSIPSHRMRLSSSCSTRSLLRSWKRRKESAP
mmetsp:Transcript_22800/g.50710  ORF Transcript_22800/g.50710 Transcript_22800/m.50710 type:complete len:414 (-) Transcript_22800:1039-2280(-)